MAFYQDVDHPSSDGSTVDYSARVAFETRYMALRGWRRETLTASGICAMERAWRGQEGQQFRETYRLEKSA